MILLSCIEKESYLNKVTQNVTKINILKDMKVDNIRLHILLEKNYKDT